MNKLKNIKYKTSPENGGIFNKFAKRYNTVSAKFLRKSPGRNGKTAPVSTGSYDMNGVASDDHKLEIGAPVLISKTTIDDDLKQLTTLNIEPNSRISSASTTATGSDNEYYTDAVSTIPSIEQDIKFEFYSSNDIPTVVEERLNQSDSAENYYAVPQKQSQPVPPRLKKTRSQSAQNLHRTELKLFLQRVPSLEATQNITTANLENCYDLPRRSRILLNSHLTSTKSKSNSISEPNSPQSPSGPKGPFNGTVHCQSTSSLNHHHSSNQSIMSHSATSIQETSNESLHLRNSYEDFDLKSASFQSLDPKSLFLSIDELNEITRQINETENFDYEIDTEYCEHRDNLAPNERRITLLKNKNAKMINLNRKREKINNAWSGLKTWIGEESGKIKDVVQKHAAMQRVGGGSGDSQVNGHSTPVNGNTLRKNGFDSKRSSSGVSYAPSMVSVAQSFGSTIVGNGGASSNDVELRVSHNSTENSSRSDAEQQANGSYQEGQNGFEELRRYIKQGGDFGKELAVILQERVDAEQLYAKSLTKMASKLNKACREIPGTIADAWRGVANEMETRSEVHRQFSNSMVEELVKPLKILADSQHKSRKSVESCVDKASRVLADWRISEGKAKKQSHTAARENEKLQDGMLDVRIQRSPSIAMLQHGTLSSKNGTTADKELKSAEKDCAKLDNKRRKAEEAVKRADVEYYTLCIRSERARVDWEMAVLRGSNILQNLENQRLTNMNNYVSSYLRLTSEMNPVLEGLVVRLAPQIEACNVVKDLNIVKNIRKVSEGPSEQLLPDFYCEHTTLAMNRERRKHALVKLLQLVRTDIERERRSRNGLKSITQTLSAQDNQNVIDKLYHIRSMLTYLEGSRFKLQSALLELDHKPRTTHPLASHIQITRDRTGLQQSILKVPLWLKNNDNDELATDIETDSPATNGSCLDIKNDILIKNFDRCHSMNRSKSTTELLHHIQNRTHMNGKISTLPPTTIVNGHNNTNGSCKDSTDDPDFDRGQADGGSNQPDSDFDEFSSQDDEDEVRHSKLENHLQQLNDKHLENKENGSKSVVISKCKALYSYTPKLYDELELNPGDVIEVHMKQDDGWWLGQLKNRVGIFPATYVEELI